MAAVLGALGGSACASTQPLTAQHRIVHRMGHKRAKLSQMVRRNFPQPTLVDPQGKPATTYQQWAARSYMPLPQGRIVVDSNMAPYGTRIAGYQAAEPGRIHTDPEVHGTPGERMMFLHEMGHLDDYHTLGAGPNPSAADVINNRASRLRQGFADITGDRRPWIEQAGNTLQAPAERFADAYSELAQYGPDATARRHAGDPTYDAASGDLTPNQYRRIANLIRQANGYPAVPLQRRLARVRHRGGRV